MLLGCELAERAETCCCCWFGLFAVASGVVIEGCEKDKQGVKKRWGATG